MKLFKIEIYFNSLEAIVHFRTAWSIIWKTSIETYLKISVKEKNLTLKQRLLKELLESSNFLQWSQPRYRQQSAPVHWQCINSKSFRIFAFILLPSKADAENFHVMSTKISIRVSEFPFSWRCWSYARVMEWGIYSRNSKIYCVCVKSSLYKSRYHLQS